MYNYRQEKTRQRTIGIVFVALFHLLLIWALLTGLARELVKVVQHKVEVKLLEDPPPPPPPPPPPKKIEPPPKKIEIPKVQEYVPPPEIAPPVVQSTNTISAIKSDPVPPPPAKPKGNLSASGNCKAMPPPNYPRKALQNEISGAVLVRFKVGADGRLADIVGLTFNKIPSEFRSDFQREINGALRQYVCDQGLEDAVLEKEFVFNIE